MKSTKQMVVEAIRPEHADEMTIAKMRAVSEWSKAWDSAVLHPGIGEIEVTKEDIDSLGGLVGSVESVESLRNIITDWAPNRTGLAQEMKDVVTVINNAGWKDGFDDGVGEETRRINFNRRSKFIDAIIRMLVVRYAEVWSRHPPSLVMINTMHELGLLDRASGQNGALSVSGAMSDFEKIATRKMMPFERMPDSMIMLAAKVENERWSDMDVAPIIKSSRDINENGRPDIEWLVDGMIPKTMDMSSPFVGFLYGNSGTYKSFIAAGICSALVKGKDNAAGFAGLAKVSGDPVSVLYLSGEDSYGIRLRFEAEFGGIVPEGVSMNLNELESVIDSNGNFDPAIARAVSDMNPDLVVMDTMNSLKLCENNNSSAAVSKMMHKLKELGTTVMIVHHSTKGGDSMEGSHAMTSNADFVLRTDIVEREDDIPVVELSCGKLKNAAKFKSMTIELVDKEDSLVCRNHEQYEKSREDAAVSGEFEPTVLRVIAESGSKGMTRDQIKAHDDINYKSGDSALTKWIDRRISKMKSGWGDVIKVSQPGLETIYILKSEHEG